MLVSVGVKRTAYPQCSAVGHLYVTECIVFIINISPLNIHLRIHFDNHFF